jgi:segregation and condensation protein B
VSDRQSATAPRSIELLAAIEAVLFAAGEPVDLGGLALAFGGLEEEEVQAAVEALGRSYDERGSGLAVEKVAGGYQLATRSEAGSWVRSFFRHHHRARLSPAALETLAIVAYRQPITSPEIQAIRGVDPAGALRSLLEKKMIRILGKKRVVGSPLLYGTSRTFLVHFGLDRLEDLPSIEEFGKVLGILEAARPDRPALVDAARDDEGTIPDEVAGNEDA